MKSLHGNVPSESDFGEMLRQAIQKSGIPQDHLSTITGVRQEAISEFLAGGELLMSAYNSLLKAMNFRVVRNTGRHLKKHQKKIKPQPETVNVIRLLESGKSYEQINESTGKSITAIRKDSSRFRRGEYEL